MNQLTFPAFHRNLRVRFRFLIPVLLISLVAFSLSARAQRHLAQQRGLELTAGLANSLPRSSSHSAGDYVSIGLSRYYSQKAYLKVSYGLDRKAYRMPEGGAVSHRHLAGIAYYRTLLTDGGGRFYLSLSSGGLFGYESLRSSPALQGAGLTLAARSKIIYGLSAGIESELFLSDRLAWILQFNERYLLPSDLQRFRWQLGTGLKWILAP